MLRAYSTAAGQHFIEQSPHTHIIGIDEVGLGACAGPLVVGGVLALKNWANDGVKDSKAFSDSPRFRAHDKRLRVLNEYILPEVLFAVTMGATAEDVDTLGVGVALQVLTRGVYMLCRQHSRELGVVDQTLTVMDGKDDGCLFPAVYEDTICFPKADTCVQAVSAASIVAKVKRDTYMLSIDERYPQYGFAKHKGYATVQHRLAVAEYGLCDEHRRSYGKFIAAATGRRYT